MRDSFISGMSFGLTSGIITTLGLMIGLNSGTGQKLVVLSGILTIAFADGMSDALGVHLSSESEKKPKKEVWEETIVTFLSKAVFALTFAIPVLLFELQTAINVSIFYGLVMITLLSTYIAKKQKESAWKAVLEHLAISIFVIVSTHFIGLAIKKAF